MAVYTVQEVADLLRVSTATIRKLIHSNKIEYTIVNKSYRITEQQVNDFMESCRVVK